MKQQIRPSCPCDNLNWHIVLMEFNRLTTDVIRVPREALEDVVRCHMIKFPDYRLNELIARTPRNGSSTVEVRRDVLFKLIKEHG